LRALAQRILWLATGRAPRPVPAFDWIRGRVGSRQNPDGMRSLVHAGLALSLGCAAVDVWVLGRHEGDQWALLAFLHTGWIFGFILAAVLNVGFLETIDGVQLRHLGGPNVLTLSRGFALPPLIYLIGHGDFTLAAGFYALAMTTDVVDGWWARHGGGQTKLGIVLDPVVDLTFHLGVFVSLSLVGLLGQAALVLTLLRSGLLILGTGLLYLWKGQVRIQPTPFGKATGFLLSLGTFTLLVVSGAAAPGPGAFTTWAGVLRTGLVVLLASAVVHVVAIGLVNLSYPPASEARWPGGWE
jgi:phosphatidylglycerophosphate synthase